MTTRPIRPRPRRHPAAPGCTTPLPRRSRARPGGGVRPDDVLAARCASTRGSGSPAAVRRPNADSPRPARGGRRLLVATPRVRDRSAAVSASRPRPSPTPSPTRIPVADRHPVLPIPADPVTVPIPGDPDHAHGQRRGDHASVPGDRREGPLDADRDGIRAADRPGDEHGRGRHPDRRDDGPLSTASRSTRTASGSPIGTRRRSSGSTRPPRR